MREYGLAFVDLEESPTPSPSIQPSFIIDPEPKWQPLYIKMSSRNPAAVSAKLHPYDKPVPVLTYCDIQKNKMPTVLSNQKEFTLVIIGMFSSMFDNIS